MSRKTILTEGISWWLGAIPDAELAELAGAKRSTTGIWRRRRSLKACRISPQEPRNGEICLLLLATQNAALVAKAYGLSRERIRLIANRRGIKTQWVQG
jgi:hypothetical protein